MAVTKVTEDWQDVELGIEAHTGVSGNTGSLTRKFVVSFDGSEPASTRVILAQDASAGGESIPLYWAVHPYDANYYVTRKRVRPERGPMNWSVYVIYEYVENPLLQHYAVEFVPQGTMEAIDKAIQGTVPFSNDLVNSAYEPFDPPIQEEFYDMAVVITRNEAAFPAGLAMSFLNKINLDNFNFTTRNGAFYSFAAQTVLCKNITAREVRHGMAWYWEVTYEFIYRPDGWARRVLDQGFRTYDHTEKTYTNITDADGNPVTMPVKLNGLGGVLAADQPAVFNTYVTKASVSFAGFNF